VRLLRFGDEQLQLAAHLPSLGVGEVGIEGAFGALRRDVRGQQCPQPAQPPHVVVGVAAGPVPRLRTPHHTALLVVPDHAGAQAAERGCLADPHAPTIAAERRAHRLVVFL
jgi:hypothetical protein